MSTMLITAVWVNEDEISIPSVVSWTDEDPLTVTVKFLAKSGLEAWVFGRDLIADALDDSSPLRWHGEGDVRVARGVKRPGLDNTLQLCLRTPAGSAFLRTDGQTIRDFLDGTYREVARGAEELAIDDALARILG